MRAVFVRGASLVVIALSLLAARNASAKQRFVDIIATHLALPYQPPCRVCHIQGTTGPGSVQTAFGVSMLAHGLTSGAETVPPALDGLAAEMIDSDGDGVPDIDELQRNTDPNTAVDVALVPGDGPNYGCAIVAGRRAHATGLAATLFAGLLIAGRRSTRRSRGRGAGR